MALDDFQMPSFRDPDGTTYIWDSASKSYVKAPLTDKRPDQSHATGGDNDLFDPFQHTEMDSVPELEGYMARKAQIDDPPFPAEHEVKCPNCGETTAEHTCPNCMKDLTPEWNVHGQDNEFFDTHHDFNDASEFWTWPQNVPHKNELNYDDSFPSMSLSKTAEALPDEWDDVFADATPARIEVGKWILDVHGQLHVGQGAITHPEIEARDGLDQEHEIALGSVYNDGSADVQMIFQPDWFNLQAAQDQIAQAFGPVELHPPMGQAEQKSEVFPPFEIAEGQWFIPPQTQPITGIAWVKERSNGVEYQPHMILCAEHLRDDDFILYNQGAACIVTAFGGGASHAAYLAMTQGLPVITGIGESYNKVETGNYLKIDPTSETITVMPGATGEMPSEQKQQIWNSILDYQRQRGGSVTKPKFAHFHEELAWKEANEATLESCPEDGAPMIEQDGEMVCHDCGHKQPIIQAHARVEVGGFVTPLYNRISKRHVNGLVVVATEGAQIVGYMTAEPIDGGFLTDYIEVHPAYRGRGIATAMVRKGREFGTIPYTSQPNQVYQSEAGKALAAKVGGVTPNLRTAKVVTGGKAALAAPLVGGEAGGGIAGIGSMMKGALGRGMAFQMGQNMMGGGGGGVPGQGALDSASNAVTNEQPQQFDPNAGTVAHVAAMQREAFLGWLSGLIEQALAAAKAAGGAVGQQVGNIPWSQIGNYAGQALLNNPLDDAAMAALPGAAGALKDNATNQVQQVHAALGDDNVGLATDNDGTNSTDEASTSGIEGKKEQGDGPEMLKDVDGGHDSQDKDSGDNLEADPHMQDKALKAFHMNLPLVIEFANSEEPGADNPILQALDAMLEEAFPGYKDGMEEGGETSEHPEEEKSDEASDSEPDEKSEGDDKGDKEIHIHTKVKEASVWHYADLKDYEHWNEEAPRVWWEEEGRHPEAEDLDYGDPYDDYQQQGAMDAAAEELFESMGNLDDYDLEMLIAGDPHGQINLPYMEHFSPEEIKSMAQDALADRQAQTPSSPEFEERNLGTEDHFAKTAAGGPEAWNMRRTLDGPWDEWQQEEAQPNMYQQPTFQQDEWRPYEGAPEAYSCMNCGEQHEFPGNTDPRDLPACPQCGARSWTHSGLQQTYAKTSTLDPHQQGMGAPMPAGGGGPAMQICPRCGQAHTAGAACPVADVTTPLTTGDPTSQAGTSEHVITKWHLAMPANVPASQPQQAAGAPAAPATCPQCGCNHIPGTPCPTYNNQAGGTQQPAATGQPANLATPPVGPGVQYSHVAAEDAHHDDFDADPNPDPTSDHSEDHTEDHGDSDWLDEAGNPLEEGAQYEMTMAESPIPDRVTIERILPERLTVLYHTGITDFRDTIDRDQLEMDGATFTPVDFDDTGEDSMDTFPGEEMPPRPGDDALPQEDDLSVPSTVMSSFEDALEDLPEVTSEQNPEAESPIFEPVSLDTYTGSFQGDKVDDRSWLMEGGGSVDVDPALMAKVAGKDFSAREQREFIDEKGEARNLDRLDLSGTHYIDEELHTSDSLW